ncbi:hypothetical protein ACOMHN_008077 [Nucella lapillus]
MGWPGAAKHQHQQATLTITATSGRAVEWPANARLPPGQSTGRTVSMHGQYARSTRRVTRSFTRPHPLWHGTRRESHGRPHCGTAHDGESHGRTHCGTAHDGETPRVKNSLGTVHTARHTAAPTVARHTTVSHTAAPTVARHTTGESHGCTHCGTVHTVRHTAPPTVARSTRRVTRPHPLWYCGTAHDGESHGRTHCGTAHDGESHSPTHCGTAHDGESPRVKNTLHGDCKASPLSADLAEWCGTTDTGSVWGSSLHQPRSPLHQLIACVHSL